MALKLRLLTEIAAPALTLGFLCGLIQLVIVSILCQGLNVLFADSGYDDYTSFCQPANTITSLTPRTTPSGSKHSRTASSTTVSIIAHGRTRRSISNECYSIRHAHGLSYDSMYSGYCYLVFTSVFYMLCLLTIIVVWNRKLWRGHWVWAITVMNVLTTVFLLAAIGVGADSTAFPFWPFSTLML